MEKFLLVINTTVQNKIFVALARGDKFYNQASERSKNRSFYFRASADNIGFKTLYKKSISTAKSDKLLLLIDKILKNGKVEPKGLGGIIVVAGPGSFTAVRQGVVAANALGFFLKVPVVSLRGDEFVGDRDLLKIGYEKMKKAKVGELALPFYGHEPNITMPKPKL